MNDEKEEVGGLPKLKLLYETLPAEVKGVIAFLLMCLLLIPAAILLVPLALEKHCWEFQAKDHRFFKFNSCNGEVIEITEEYLEKARVKSGEPN
jgi:TRAP-type mannitol/chloroaromatic compound transport system permease small subunit